MPIFIHNGTGFQAASQPGGLRPLVHNGSAWQNVNEVYVHDGTNWRLAYQYDSTGPTIASIAATPNQNGTITVSWGAITDSESGVASAYVERFYQESGQSALASEVVQSLSVFGAGSLVDTTPSSRRRNPTTNRDWYVYYRIVATDVAGNVSATAFTTTITKPLGTFNILATETATWETAGTPSWRTDTDDVISGRFDATYEFQTGYWFYGNQVQSLANGYRPSSGTILMIRQGTQGVSPSPNKIAPHDAASRPASAPAWNFFLQDNGPTLSGSDASVAHPLPSGWLDWIRDGLLRGAAAIDSGGFRRLKGISSNLFSGLLVLVFD